MSDESWLWLWPWVQWLPLAPDGCLYGRCSHSGNWWVMRPEEPRVISMLWRHVLGELKRRSLFLTG